MSLDHQSRIIIEETKKRALNDAFVHNVVGLVVQVLNVEHHESMGTSLSKHEQAIARIAAAMALTLVEKDPTDGSSVIEKTIAVARNQQAKKPIRDLA